MRLLLHLIFFLSLSFNSELLAQNLFKSFVFQMPMEEAKLLLNSSRECYHEKTFRDRGSGIL